MTVIARMQYEDGFPAYVAMAWTTLTEYRGSLNGSIVALIVNVLPTLGGPLEKSDRKQQRAVASAL